MSDITAIFPDDLASNKQKANWDTGLQVGKAIENQWYTNGALSQRRLWIDKMRQYSKGEQSTDEYKKTIEGTREKKKKGIDIKTHKIDYTPLKVLSTFKGILINPIDEDFFKPRAEALDITAVNEKKDFFKKLDKSFHNKPFDDIIKKGIGIDLSPKTLPNNIEELSVQKLEYKPKIEIAQELAIENVMKHESFEAVKDKVNEDLFDLGIGVVQHYTDYSEGIKVKYIDMYDYINSPFEIDDGRDIRYHGIAKRGTIAELIKLSGGISTANLTKIKNEAIGKPENTDPYIEEEDSSRLVEWFSFSYLTSETREFKRLRKNKSTKLIDRTKDGYNPSNQKKKISIPYEVWYEGVYVPMAEVILKWEKIPNQVEKDVNKPISPFIVYAPNIKKLSEKGSIRFDSMVNRSIPIVDDMHRDWFKFQQLKMELRPTTVTISPRLLNKTFLNGEPIPAQDLLDMYFGRGLLLADEFDEDGDKIGDAIKEQGGGINNNSITFISSEFSNNYDRLRQLLGINEVRDGSNSPNTRTAVTIQKLLLASSNNATSHIVKASFTISLKIAESISYRLYDVLTTPALKERYMSIIGSRNVELLEHIKKIPMHKFGIYFDFKPDSEERITFETSLVNSYENKEINVAQYNKARQIRNVKSAINYLEYIIKKNSEEIEENKRINIKAQAEANAQTSVLTEQTKQQTLTVAYEIKKQEKLLDAQISSQQSKEKALLDELSAQKQHVRAIELAIIEGQQKSNIESEKEDRRDKRIDQTSTNTSKIADQKANNKPPIDFKNELDSIFKDNPLIQN